MSFISMLSQCLILLVILPHHLQSLEPLTMGAIAVGSLGFGSYFKEYTYCKFVECCDDRSIPSRIDKLKVSLDQTLIGQHIVKQLVIPALKAHITANSQSRKPLVISFQGPAGTGKNLVAEQIADALYLLGSKSSYVKKYLGQADFPNKHMVAQYKTRLNSEVRDSLRRCPRSLFIFDEVDKMASGVFDTLASLADYNAFVDGTDSTKAIFIFISNTAGKQIGEHLASVMKIGTLREDTRLSDFEPLLRKAAYNMDGGLKGTTMIQSHVIDHYLPFLPMEKGHVVQCLENEFYRWNRNPKQAKNQEIIEDIINHSISYDRAYNLFVISGCKTLEKKVSMAINL